MTTQPAYAQDLDSRALRALRALVADPQARFHDGQRETIRALVERHERALVVQRTGWGKSAVYFVATVLLRTAGSGPSLIVSPLLALMRDQIAAAQRAGIRAVTISSANATQWGEVFAAIAADEVDVLLVSPERLANPRFHDEAMPKLLASTGLLVVDEAHCISDWGHDFRPDYRRIRDVLTALAPGTPVLATTATANSRVVADIDEQLRAGSPAPVSVVRGPLARASLRLGVLELERTADRLGWLCAHLGDFEGSGIIYTLTVSAAEDLAVLLRGAGHDVRAYTGRTDTQDREQLEQALRDNRVKALVATSALGMGFDKPDLGYVIHLGAPSSPIAYYQQVGRAGRGTPRADVLLLPGVEDRPIWSYFAMASMPTKISAGAVLDVLADGGTYSTPALEALVDVRRTRLELLLKVLAADGAVRRVSGGWAGTGVPWVYDAERYERVAETRRAEQEAMLGYVDTAGCRMAFLQECLDDPTAAPCGRCDRCAGRWFDGGVPASAAEQAGTALRAVGLPLEPRTQWPTGMDRLAVPEKGKIGSDRCASAGRVLARLTDLGMGQRMRALLDGPDGPVDDAVLAACTRVLHEWDWEQRPVAVASVASRHRPQLVATLAAGLSALGRLRDLGPLDLVDGGPRGTSGGSSAFRLAAIWGRLAVPAAMAPELASLDGPVLLVDDLVDSRWTMTVAADLLRRGGALGVLPFALASAG